MAFAWAEKSVTMESDWKNWFVKGLLARKYGDDIDAGESMTLAFDVAEKAGEGADLARELVKELMPK